MPDHVTKQADLTSMMTSPRNWAVQRFWAALHCAKRPVRVRPINAILARAVLLLGLLAAGFSAQPALAVEGAAQPAVSGSESIAAQDASAPSATKTPPMAAPQHARRASFEQEHASPQARHVANWVVDSRDNRSLPFLIVDKSDARVFLFDASGRLRGAAPALLGLAQGDDAVPGIGNRKLSTILPEERTTPAGRFVASLDKNLHGEEILWVDYDTAIALHRVITSNAKERRAQRLESSSPSERRISYGCINVPVKFYENVVSPAFTGTNGIVYVLPETRSARQVFGSYDVEEPAQPQATSHAEPEPTGLQAAR
ncbi:MAG: hypothetical protein ABI642_07160 [Polaromonas sp.]